jgi:hypothetical protein
MNSLGRASGTILRSHKRSINTQISNLSKAVVKQLNRHQQGDLVCSRVFRSRMFESEKLLFRCMALEILFIQFSLCTHSSKGFRDAMTSSPKFAKLSNTACFPPYARKTDHFLKV